MFKTESPKVCSAHSPGAPNALLICSAAFHAKKENKTCNKLSYCKEKFVKICKTLLFLCITELKNTTKGLLKSYEEDTETRTHFPEELGTYIPLQR